MKSFPDAASQGTPVSRKKRRPTPLPHEIRQIAHQLLDHLTVINLSSFKLRSQLGATGAGALSGNAESLERAVTEATLCAENLAQVIADTMADVRSKKTGPADPAKPNGNVVPLFARPR